VDRKLLKLKERQNETFSAIAQILSGVGAPVRIRLIHFLSQGPLTVETLSKKIDQSVANTSMHLRKMLALNIVSVSVKGKMRLYSLHSAAFAFWEACQDFVQAVDPALKLDTDDVYESIDWNKNLKETISLAKKKSITLLDARPTEEVSEGIEGLNVVHISSADIKKNVSKLNKKKPVLVFCRGRLCVLPAFVVNELRQLGFDAYRLNGSWFSLKNLI